MLSAEFKTAKENQSTIEGKPVNDVEFLQRWVIFKLTENELIREDLAERVIISSIT